MDRRQFVSAAATCGLLGSAGCIASTSEGSSGSNEEDDRTRLERIQDVASTSGESVEYQYQVATVNQLVLAEEVIPAANEQDADEEEPEAMEPPTAGGLWALCELEIEHTGDQRREYPGASDSFFIYEDYDESELFTPDSPVEVRGDRYPMYHEQYSERAIDSRGAFPGVTLSGWLLYEVPRLYDLDEFTVVVPLGVDSERHPWVFDEDHVTRVPSRDYDG